MRLEPDQGYLLIPNAPVAHPLCRLLRVEQRVCSGGHPRADAVIPRVAAAVADHCILRILDLLVADTTLEESLGIIVHHGRHGTVGVVAVPHVVGVLPAPWGHRRMVKRVAIGTELIVHGRAAKTAGKEVEAPGGGSRPTGVVLEWVRCYDVVTTRRWGRSQCTSSRRTPGTLLTYTSKNQKHLL